MKKNVLLATAFVAGLITMGIAQLPSGNHASPGNLSGHMALDTVPKKDTVPDKDSSAQVNAVSLVSHGSYMAKDTVPKKDTVPGKTDSTSIKL